MLKRLSVVAAIAFLTATAAYAGGIFQGYPIVGGPSYCVTTVNGHCSESTAVAPGYIGGYVPADTMQANGFQTVLIPSSTMGAGVDNEVPLTGASITLGANVSKLMINPAGTIAALTVTLPAAASLFDGQVFYVNSSQIVTALTLTAGSGTTLGTTTTALAVNTPIRYTYMAATQVWVKG